MLGDRGADALGRARDDGDLPFQFLDMTLLLHAGMIRSRRHRRRDVRDIPCGADDGGSAGLRLLGDGAAGAGAHSGDDDDRRARNGIPASVMPL